VQKVSGLSDELIDALVSRFAINPNESRPNIGPDATPTG